MFIIWTIRDIHGRNSEASVLCEKALCEPGPISDFHFYFRVLGEGAVTTYDKRHRSHMAPG